MIPRLKYFARSVVGSIEITADENILVIGTEEFMYLAIRLGHLIKTQSDADEVRVLATTRSPIIVSSEEGYPLNKRYQLRSLYENDRVTFTLSYLDIYNLSKYDKVIIVTDATSGDREKDLVEALKNEGNQDILIARWYYKNRN